jgi:hypothetical protein
LNNRNLNFLKIGGFVAVAIALLLLPADFFDHGQSLCLSKLIANLECPGCGITRAIQHLIHFDFDAAWHFNKLSFIVFPILAFLYARQILRWYQKTRVTQAG